MGEGLQNFIYLALIWLAVLGAFFWLMWRPQRRRLARHQELIEGLERGDRVVTAGGIHGEIVGLQEQTITLEVTKGVQLKLDRRAVRRKYGDEDEEA